MMVGALMPAGTRPPAHDSLHRGTPPAPERLRSATPPPAAFSPYSSSSLTSRCLGHLPSSARLYGPVLPLPDMVCKSMPAKARSNPGRADCESPSVERLRYSSSSISTRNCDSSLTKDGNSSSQTFINLMLGAPFGRCIGRSLEAQTAHTSSSSPWGSTRKVRYAQTPWGDHSDLIRQNSATPPFVLEWLFDLYNRPSVPGERFPDCDSLLFNAIGQHSGISDPQQTTSNLKPVYCNDGFVESLAQLSP
jgi:hypothetical protein